MEEEEGKERKEEKEGEREGERQGKKGHRKDVKISMNFPLTILRERIQWIRS